MPCTLISRCKSTHEGPICLSRKYYGPKNWVSAIIFDFNVCKIAKTAIWAPQATLPAIWWVSRFLRSVLAKKLFFFTDAEFFTRIYLRDRQKGHWYSLFRRNSSVHGIINRFLKKSIPPFFPCQTSQYTSFTTSKVEVLTLKKSRIFFFEKTILNGVHIDFSMQKHSRRSHLFVPQILRSKKLGISNYFWFQRL